MLLLNLLNNLFLEVDTQLLSNFVFRLILNMSIVFILVRFIYYPYNFQKEYFFNLLFMALVVFLIATVLQQLNLDFALALGIFAVFSILRYRTVQVDIKEMTYFMAVIGISLVNAMVEFDFAIWLGLLISNLALLVVALFLEKYQPKQNRNKKIFTFHYKNYDIVNDKKVLLKVVREVSNINVLKVDLVKINATKQEITVWIYFQN